MNEFVRVLVVLPSGKKRYCWAWKVGDSLFVEGVGQKGER